MIGKLTIKSYILKKRERIPTTEEKRRFIHHYQSLFESIKEGCRLMGIKRSTLYYQQKDNLDKKIKETDIKNKIKDISYKHPYYGYRRITAQLRRDKVIVNHKRVLRMMRKMGIQGRIKHQYITTTNSKHNNKIYSNLIKDKELTGINQVWCADITYIRILNGLVYLAAIIDIYSRKIVGYAIGKTLYPKLAIVALSMAIATRNTDNLIHHSDQGSKFPVKITSKYLKITVSE